MKVAIIGNGILGNLGAMYLQKKFADKLDIWLIGPDSREGLPVVGESIIEITTMFLEEELGMADYLHKHHLPKYALTYYFKMDPDDPTDRTYAVHCNERGPDDLRKLEGWEGPMDNPPSWLINREVFDRDIREMVAAMEGIHRIDGHVRDVQISSDSQNVLYVDKADGDLLRMEVDWVIDVSGRKQVLPRKLDNIIRPEGQRDCFWFRVAGFDRDILKAINALGPMPPGPGEAYHYDRYYSTHHFMGRGNWIWMIPMKGEDGRDLMSIGFVSHPDHFDGNVNSMESFLAQVDKTHPVVGELVRSGEVLDTNLLKRYHYVVNPMYSADRWAVIGDAAYAPDPLFSNGLAFGTIQWEQVGSMIKKDMEGMLDASFVTSMAEAFLGPVLATQTAISNWYATMHDPVLSAIRLNWIEISYFYLFLPLVVNECHFREDRLNYWKLLQNTSEIRPFDISQDLIQARQKLGPINPDHFVYMGKEKVNPRAMEVLKDLRGIHEQGVAGGMVRKEYTRQILERIEKIAPSLVVE